MSFPFVIIQEFYSNMHGFDYSIPSFIISIHGTHIVVALELIFDVLYVSKESHPDYPGCLHLKTVSKDELCLSFVRRLLHGVTVKTPHARALQKIRDS